MTAKSFTESFGFIVFFLIGTLVFTMVFGEKAAMVFLLLVLLGMVFTNVDKFTSLIGRYSKP